MLPLSPAACVGVKWLDSGPSPLLHRRCEKTDGRGVVEEEEEEETRAQKGEESAMRGNTLERVAESGKL